jgi:ABC-type Fe3+/spermidine/putrescine transport system ATPase subunit
MARLEWTKVSKNYGGTPALEGVSLSVQSGEVLGILGPSGSGKSTLLRIAAGLEEADTGSVLLDGKDVSGTPPHCRDFGLMFQDFCLFPHLDVSENVGFGLRMRRWGRERRNGRIAEMLKLVEMGDFAHRSVHRLSGGEQQRVALARSLAPSPRVLMLDEPLGALDATLRKELLSELGDILAAVGVTTVYVTHDQEEAMSIAKRIALLRAGRLEQLGAPAHLIAKPENAFVASFLALGAVVHGAFRRHDGEWIFYTDLGAMPLGNRAENRFQLRKSSDWTILVRPAAVYFTPRPGSVKVRARVVSRTARPEGERVRLSLLGKNGSAFPLELPVGSQNPNSGKLPFPAAGNLWIDTSRCSLVPR